MEIDRASLEAWCRDQPLSILQLDPADRAVLRVAGKPLHQCTTKDRKGTFAMAQYVLSLGRAG